MVEGSKETFETIGKASQGMAPAKANLIRTERKAGKELSNIEKREKKNAEKEAQERHFTIFRIWEFYLQANSTKLITKIDKTNVKRLEPFFQKSPHEITNNDISDFQVQLVKAISIQTNSFQLTISPVFYTHFPK